MERVEEDRISIETFNSITLNRVSCSPVSTFLRKRAKILHEYLHGKRKEKRKRGKKKYSVTKVECREISGDLIRDQTDERICRILD